MDDAISAAWDAGKQAWPDVALDRDRFETYARTLDPEAAAKFPADIYLAAACLGGDPVALARVQSQLEVSLSQLLPHAIE